MRCGLLGGKLGHSYSPAIHRLLADYDYRLYEKTEAELADFLRSDTWDGLNVTIPYKKAVLPYCADCSETARRLGSVNTLLRRPDGSIYGDNTDFYGFSYMLQMSGISLTGAKALVFGSGGASVTVCAVLRTMGAGEVVVISRAGADNYENLSRHADAEILVNTTPLGMYPNNGETPVTLSDFPACRGVLDIVYNPAQTALLLAAAARGIPCAGGLTMLVAQAKRSCELFIGRAVDDGKIADIVQHLLMTQRNIVLVGMPGSGKSTVARCLAARLQRPLYDADEEIERRAGCTIPALFSTQGEAAFRTLETQVLAELGKLSGAVIATGGGCVLREENEPLLRQNSVIFWIQRSLERLDRSGRPLSQKIDLAQMYAERRPLYERFADYTVVNEGLPEEAAEKIVRDMS